ncbi:MAG: hypothetical protein K5778_10495 [Bacteroidaceae bacterium]|nr:hypothetical protein [Bacteroidaceae bacterium]
MMSEKSPISIVLYNLLAKNGIMIKANDTIFRFYLAMMDSFEKYLSERYPECNSIEDTKHYQTNIIEKIVRMFHTLELLTKNTLDEVSARCILRGIIDSVTAYCFIYQRADKEEILFRHYLYALDGWKVYNKSVLGISEKNEFSNKEECLCNHVIKQIEDKLHLHPFYAQDSSAANKIILSARWNYESLQNPRSIKYGEMYSLVGFNSSLTEYFQGYLSQFVHGLCFSNKGTNPEVLKTVMYESIIFADKFVQAICQAFRDQEMVNHFLFSDTLQKFLASKDFNCDDLADFASALVQKDKTLLI